MTGRYSPLTFEMTADHIALMKRTYFTWDGDAYDGAPAVGIKRPYGNSDVLGDLVEELVEPTKTAVYDREGDFISGTTIGSREVFGEESLMAIHREMETALQIVVNTQQAALGLYRKRDTYGATTWERVEE